MPEMFLELFSEEIPARMQADAEKELARLFEAKLKDAGFEALPIRTYSTPRRLVAVIDDLPAQQPDRREERKGPKVGAPEKAMEGFLKSVGMSLDEVEKRDTDKGQVYFAVIERKGRPTPEVLSEILGDVITGFHWPKSMRWGLRRLRWVRPLQRITFLFDGAVVPFEIEGIQSGDETEGHRFMAPGAIRVRNFADYQDRLAAAHVVLDPAERRAKIEAGAADLVKAEGLELVEDKGLLNEVAGLVEWPVVIMGSFDDAFLKLPDEVLISTMKGHQKYFSVRDPKTGRLAARFITVANLTAKDGGAKIREGNERVLRARLSDARFFWDQDLKTPLEDNLPKLEEIVFHAKLGSVAAKVERMEKLAAKLAPLTGAEEGVAKLAMRLAKADLVSGMVYEFPELQGLMGRYYALHSGRSEAVADAIRDHYAPAGPSDDCPSTPVSMAAALADKLDTLAGFWAIDEKPTGSKDPFALRRAALGVIRIILENDLRLNLAALFAFALEQYREAVKASFETDALVADLMGFFADRMKVHMRERDIRHDLVDAVFALPGQDDLVLITRRADALKNLLGTEDGANLLAGYKRAVNILKIEEKKDGASYDGQVTESLLAQAEEKDLFGAIGETCSKADGLAEKEDFEGAMTALAGLRPQVDAFFDKVTVNADEQDVRRNRLALLAEIRSRLTTIADFSRIEG